MTAERAADTAAADAGVAGAGLAGGARAYVRRVPIAVDAQRLGLFEQTAIEDAQRIRSSKSARIGRNYIYIYIFERLA